MLLFGNESKPLIYSLTGSLICIRPRSTNSIIAVVVPITFVSDAISNNVSVFIRGGFCNSL